MVSNRLGDKKGTNLSVIGRFNEALKTLTLFSVHEALSKLE